MPHRHTPVRAAEHSNLQPLRSKIDRIDNALLELMEQRLSLSLEIADQKRDTSSARPHLRPEREHEVIDRLAIRSEHLSKTPVGVIWRELLTLSLQAQNRTELALNAIEQPIAVTNAGRFGCVAPRRLRLIDRLNPDNRPGRLVPIGRFGAGRAAERLPGLMRAARRSGSNAIWSIDPMHGNTTSVGGRSVRNIGAELSTFFEVARAEGVHPGGVHLELTGDDVTECLEGSRPLTADDLPRRYLTHCDPGPNRAQALDLTAELARQIEGGARRASAA